MENMFELFDEVQEVGATFLDSTSWHGPMVLPWGQAGSEAVSLPR